MGDASRPSPSPRRGRSRRRARVETSAGGVVFRRGDDGYVFLLIRDPYGNWGLPKGHIEGGETAAEAALREVTEETGLSRLTMVAQLPTIDWFFRDRGRLIHKYCHFFLVECPDGEPQPQAEEGITDCIWCAPQAALQTVSYANAREVLRVAVDWLERHGVGFDTGREIGVPG
jgi:8-oxo-dGTP pyrophosphatase MutT (NUDIX family)